MQMSFETESLFLSVCLSLFHFLFIDFKTILVFYICNSLCFHVSHHLFSKSILRPFNCHFLFDLVFHFSFCFLSLSLFTCYLST
jgi:hypothetical protein